MNIRVQRVVARLMAILIVAMFPLGVSAASASTTDDAPVLDPHPYLDVVISDVEFFPITAWDGRDRFYLNIDIEATVPGGCVGVGGCQLTVRFSCLRSDGSSAWTSQGTRYVRFSGTTFNYRYVPQYQTTTGCRQDDVAHIALVYLSDRLAGGHFVVNEVESQLIGHNGFPLGRYADALVAVAGEDQQFAPLCGNFASGSLVSQACVNAAQSTSKSGKALANAMVAAILAAGGTPSDLYALLTPAYVDPIPPPPAGHEIVDGYDLDAMAAAIDAGGGPAVLAVMVNTVPASNTNGGSTNDLAEMVLVAEKSGASTKQVLQRLIEVAGVGVLIYLTSAYIKPGDDQKADPNPPAPQPPRSNPRQGGGLGAGASHQKVDPDESTINEVLRSWYRRIHDGKLGNSAVAQDLPGLLPEEALREVARQCLKDVAAAARAGATFETTNPCRDMRILVPAGDGSGAVILDAYEAALHDRDAISLRPEWAQLNYMSGAAKAHQVQPQWYNRAPYSAISKCKDKDVGIACDEYPFYSTIQGGPVEFGGAGASLRPIDKTHNTVEGSVFGAMVNTGVCEMESAPSVPRGETATGGTPFLVVPMPGARIPSFFLC